MERKNDIWEREKEMEEKKIDNNIILVFINRIKHNLIINVHIQFKIYTKIIYILKIYKRFE